MPTPTLARSCVQAENVDTDDAVVLVHPTVGPTQADDISGEVRYLTYLVLDEQINDPNIATTILGPVSSCCIWDAIFSALFEANQNIYNNLPSKRWKRRSKRGARRRRSRRRLVANTRTPSG